MHERNLLANCDTLKAVVGNPANIQNWTKVGNRLALLVCCWHLLAKQCQHFQLQANILKNCDKSFFKFPYLFYFLYYLITLKNFAFTSPFFKKYYRYLPTYCQSWHNYGPTVIYVSLLDNFLLQNCISKIVHIL